MKTIATAIAVASAMVMLSGCLSTPLSSNQVNALRTACATIDQSYATFTTLVEGDVLTGSAAENGQLVYEASRPICALPAGATYADVAAVIAQTAVLVKLIKDAD